MNIQPKALQIKYSTIRTRFIFPHKSNKYGIVMEHNSPRKHSPRGDAQCIRLPTAQECDARERQSTRIMRGLYQNRHTHARTLAHVDAPCTCTETHRCVVVSCAHIESSKYQHTKRLAHKRARVRSYTQHLCSTLGDVPENTTPAATVCTS